MVIRTPFLPVDNSRFVKKVFEDFFVQEVDVRDRMGRAYNPGKAIVRFEGMLIRMANNIYKLATELSINPVNLSFIFLNRYYPMFIGKTTPVTKMSFFWDEFLLDFSHEQDLIQLMTYDEVKRRMVCTIVQEMRETKDSKRFQTFLTKHVGGYKVKMPDHIYERSRLFEVVLKMLWQIQAGQLNYFIENHAMEIVKAHALDLKKFGDPVKLSLGCFIGDTAMYRLRKYLDWMKRRGASFRHGHKEYEGLEYAF